MKLQSDWLVPSRLNFLAAPILALAALMVIPDPATAADVAAGQKKAEACIGCHGPNGNSRMGQYPVLAGLSARYIGIQLKDFKEGRRKDPEMSEVAKQLSPEDMQDLAVYFAAQKAASIDFKPDPEKVQLGAKKSDETLCAMCHLGGLRGQNEIPRLAGQQPDYVMKQLKAFKARTRTNDGGNMTSVAQTLSEEDMLNLANYIASLR